MSIENTFITPRQFVNTAAGEKVKDYEAMSLINGINEALKNPDGYDANLIAEYQAVAGGDNKVTVAEAEKWLKDNGKTYEDVYNYNSQFIYNLFTNNEDENKTELNNVLYEYGGKEFENNQILTSMTRELFNYLKQNDFKKDDIENLILGFNQTLAGIGITASEHDLAVATNILTNMFNASAHKYGDDKSLSFGDLTVLLEEKEKKSSTVPLLTFQMNQFGGNIMENSDILAIMADELYDYMLDHTVEEDDIEDLIDGFDASLQSKGITASKHDLEIAKGILEDLVASSSLNDDDDSSMTLEDININIVNDIINQSGGYRFKELDSKLMATELFKYLESNNINEGDIDNLIDAFELSLTEKGINISPDDLEIARMVLTNIYNISAKQDGDNTSMTLNDLFTGAIEAEKNGRAENVSLLDWGIKNECRGLIEDKDILTFLPELLYDYLKDNDIKKADIENLAEQFKTEFKKTYGKTLSDTDVDGVKTILTNLYNESYKSDGANSSMSLNDAVTTLNQKRKESDIKNIESAINLSGGDKFEDENVSKYIAEQLYDYLQDNNIDYDNIDELLSGIDIAMSDKDLATAKNVIKNLYNSSVTDENGLTTMTFNALKNGVDGINKQDKIDFLKKVLKYDEIGGNELTDKQLGVLSKVIYEYVYESYNILSEDDLDGLAGDLGDDLADEFQNLSGCNDTDKALAKTVITNYYWYLKDLVSGTTEQE